MSFAARCGYLTFEAAENDEYVRSGMNFNMRQALKLAGYEVIHLGHLGGLMPPYPWSIKARCHWHRWITRSGFDPQREPSLLRKTARRTAKVITGHSELDFLFAPHSFPVSYLPSRQPKFVWLDATFAGLIDYYPDYKNLATVNVRRGLEAEAAALRDCAGVFFSSHWAAESALRAYALDECRVHVVPLGANLMEAVPLPPARAFPTSRQEPLHLVFIGIDWRRKGGPHAVKVVRELQALGWRCIFTIVGCHPPAEDLAGLAEVRVEGFVDKTKPDGRARFQELLTRAHFFIFPTRAEAYGLVLAESAAYGLPVLATATGGVTTIVRDGETGLLFEPTAKAGKWARRINALRAAEYSSLCVAAHRKYLAELNWQSAADRVREIVDCCLISTFKSSHRISESCSPITPAHVSLQP